MFPSFDETLTSVSKELSPLEEERLHIVSFMKKHGLFLLAGSIVVMILFVLQISSVALVALVAWVLYLAFLLGIVYNKYQKHRLKFKEQVVLAMSREMLRLCEMPGETDSYRYECAYNHEERIQNTSIDESRLFDYKIDKIRGEDLFSGILGLTEFKFSELTIIQVRTQTNSKGHTTRTDVTMFDGILFVADFHKEFDGVTLLKSANLFNTGAVGGFFAPLRNLFSSMSREKKVNIDLENEDFNEAFDVQTTDEIKARYILSSSMMERLLKFKSKHREKLEVSFVHSRMYVALSSGRNYFEPKLFQSIPDTQVRVIYDDLSFFFGMVEDFDLNTRIWSKE